MSKSSIEFEVDDVIDDTRVFIHYSIVDRPSTGLRPMLILGYEPEYAERSLMPFTFYLASNSLRANSTPIWIDADGVVSYKLTHELPHLSQEVVEFIERCVALIHQL
jgi:hypothetical protein